MDRALPLVKRAIEDLAATTSEGLTLAAAYESGAWIASRNGQRELSMRWAAQAERLIGTSSDAESIRIRDGLYLLSWTTAREDGDLPLTLSIAEQSLENALRAPPLTRKLMEAQALRRRGMSFTDLGKFEPAEPGLVKALRLTEEAYGVDDYRSLRMQMLRGWFYNTSGDTKRGLTMLRAVGPKLLQVYGERSQTIGNFYFNVANADWADGRLLEARDGYLKAARTYENSGAGKTSYVGSAMWNAAKIEMELGNLARASELCDEIERRWDGVVPIDAPVRALFKETRVELARKIAERERSGK
jgi:tetratricopeptide (TPR) repeat protein